MLIALAVGVATWVAGFDIFYSLQDVPFDREQRLESLPAALGEVGAIRVARVMHVVSMGALILVGLVIHSGGWYWLGIVVASALLLYEHSLVSPGDLSKLDAAFFTMNGMISIAFFFFVLIDRLVRGPGGGFGMRLPW